MLGESSAYLPEEDLVGRETSRDELISWLTNKEPERMAYSVVGMGGLGKTTLVGKAYHSSKVQKHFNCSAWFTISQSSDTNKILRSMIKDFIGFSNPKEYDGFEYRELLKILINHLQSKRYVLILDDVWSIAAWENIKVAIPKNMMGSRIMIATRDKGVASHVAERQSNIFHPQHLNENQAWSLFCRRAFRNNRDGACPDELESSARNIVNKCDGLPLAILKIGSLMSTKQNEAEWRKVADSFGWELVKDRFLERVKNVLLLSYYELPIHLKQCFLYFCAFPEDCKIPDEYLIKIWVAEGFIEKIKGQTLEDVAMNYINELVGRCMIQYENEYTYPKYYRVHDVMREIGVSIAKDENFIISSTEREEQQDSKNARRFLEKVNSETNLSQLGFSSLCSYIAIGNEFSVTESFIGKFKFLKVLDLGGAPLQKVSNSLGELFSLRYLNLGYSNSSELPNSLKSLCNLQTLDISCSKIMKLPNWIVKLKTMSHLLVSYQSDDGIIGVEAPTGICMLKSLQTLEYVEGNKELLKKIGNLTQLKQLGIESVETANGADICASLRKMESLLKLTINRWKEQGPLELEASSFPPLIRSLVLNGKLEKLPQWIGSLKNLVALYVTNSNLSTADPLSPLEALGKLEHLSLIRTYDGDHLCFGASFCPKLNTLELSGFQKLDMIERKDGAMCHLRRMDLSDCQELKTLPMGIEYLRQLKELFSRGMPEEFTNRLGPGLTEEDRSKIKHIAVIRHL